MKYEYNFMKTQIINTLNRINIVTFCKVMGAMYVISVYKYDVDSYHFVLGHRLWSGNVEITHQIFLATNVGLVLASVFPENIWHITHTQINIRL